MVVLQSLVIMKKMEFPSNISAEHSCSGRLQSTFFAEFKPTLATLTRLHITGAKSSRMFLENLSNEEKIFQAMHFYFYGLF